MNAIIIVFTIISLTVAVISVIVAIMIPLWWGKGNEKEFNQKERDELNNFFLKMKYRKQRQTGCLRFKYSVFVDTSLFTVSISFYSVVESNKKKEGLFKKIINKSFSCVFVL